VGGDDLGGKAPDRTTEETKPRKKRRRGISQRSRIRRQMALRPYKSALIELKGVNRYQECRKELEKEQAIGCLPFCSWEIYGRKPPTEEKRLEFIRSRKGAVRGI